jgi:type I restriction enzyme M protein
MLDNITKKNIDDCRDVLVGKVPDPKSQIEQITLALIYKFMDDMDKEAVEKFKGKAKFFTGEYAKYGWRKLFDPSLSGQDMLSLYSEALEKLNTNPNIPELFRNIFKNAYLPYRDPSTLKLFLKYINEFEYSHSEKLGDAFEYLLSVMGSQGDAGQFRTPRHIIDFVTACVNPQKNETVLDPACGTAGFLLSAYKHILNQNTDKRQGDKLKPDDRKKLATNFVGYDISPDMVRLSLANMYLHGFATPLIHEYDSLSSEDRWQETFDVILANPPFMTPKGGIRPHKKFGVQANKAEVLFTDYIAEHLNSNGRAGIVVPNGIVATSQTAYKQLRKMLVQDSLIAVISLPAGVFQPYSGVKTSVLILDKRLAKKSQHILFLKIENDGFDLGAQRREIDKNDLPLALQALEAYKECLSNDKAFEDLPSLATLVGKEIISGNKDVVLNADRYFEKEATQTEFELMKLGEIGKICMCKRIFKEQTNDKGGVPFYKIGTFGKEPDAFINQEIFDDYKSKFAYPKKGDILISTSGTIGKLVVFDGKPAYFQDSNIVWIANDESKITNEFLKIILQQIQWRPTEGVTIARLYNALIEETEIPVPPLEIQQQIVAEIEGYQKIIDGAKQIVNSYKPKITINPDWEMVELGTLAKLVGGSTPSKENSSYWENGNVDWITCSDFSNSPMYIEDSIRKITEKAVKENSTSIVPKDTLVLVTRVSLGKMAFVRKPTALNQDLTALLFDKEKINKHYGYFFLLSIADKIENDGHGATVKGVTRDYVKDIKVPLPSLEEQQTIVKAIEEELQLVNANKRLIEIFEQKIKTKIGEVWGVKEEETLSMAAEPIAAYSR